MCLMWNLPMNREKKKKAKRRNAGVFILKVPLTTTVPVLKETLLLTATVVVISSNLRKIWYSSLTYVLCTYWQYSLLELSTVLALIIDFFSYVQFFRGSSINALHPAAGVRYGTFSTDENKVCCKNYLNGANNNIII